MFQWKISFHSLSISISTENLFLLFSFIVSPGLNSIHFIASGIYRKYLKNCSSIRLMNVLLWEHIDRINFFHHRKNNEIDDCPLFKLAANFYVFYMGIQYKCVRLSGKKSMTKKAMMYPVFYTALKKTWTRFIFSNLFLFFR